MRNSRKKIKLKQAVIFCGGLGKRLGNITKQTPKPLIKINGKPFIEYLISKFSRYQISNILLLCGYKSEQFKKYNKKKVNGIKINCINEKSQLGSAGALLNAKKKLKDFFLISNGDTYFDIDINKLTKNFNYKNYLGIIAGYKINSKKRKNFDNFIIKDNILLSIVKKKDNHKIINSGIAIFNKEIIEYLNKKSFSLEKEIYPRLINERKIQAVAFKKNFIDIGTQKDLKFIKKNNLNIFK